MRNSVKVMINAYNGSSKLYIADPYNAIVRTYEKMFPGMFMPFATCLRCCSPRPLPPGSLRRAVPDVHDLPRDLSPTCSTARTTMGDSPRAPR